MQELNIGFLMGAALFTGLEEAIETMRVKMHRARQAHKASSDDYWDWQ